MKSNCLECKKEFNYYPSRSSGKYCSSKCAFSSKEWRNKQRLSKLGKKHTEESRKKMSILRKGKKQSKQWIENRFKSLKKYYESRKYKTDEYIRLKNSKDMIDWRNKIFKRDNFTCQNCGDNSGGNLNAHHIISFRTIYEEYNILNKNINLFDLENGITMCEDCHKKTDTYGKHYNSHNDFKLINILRKIYNKQSGNKDSFDDFYKKKTNEIISWLKEKYLE